MSEPKKRIRSGRRDGWRWKWKVRPSGGSGAGPGGGVEATGADGEAVVLLELVPADECSQ